MLRSQTEIHNASSWPPYIISFGWVRIKALSIPSSFTPQQIDFVFNPIHSAASAVLLAYDEEQNFCFY